jgi:hypothetical protein
MKRRIAPTLVALAIAARSAGAQPTETDRSLAQSLFEQAKLLMEGANYDEACPKLEESQRLDPGGGTLLNLALCHERQGKVATAWAEFKEALSAAKRDGREDRIAAAEEHIAALEPKLPWLTVAVIEPAEGQEVTLDGVVIGGAAWGSPVSIDPGSHQVTASAPGRISWDDRIAIGAGERLTLTVPKLTPAPVAPVAPVASLAAPSVRTQTAPSKQDDATSGSSAVGWVVGGAGVALVGVGTFFGIQTLSKKKRSDELCPTDSTCTEEGARLNEEAQTSAWIANIAIGAGIVGIGAGTYLILSSGSAGEAQGRRSPARAENAGLLPGGLTVRLSGKW